MRSAPFIRVMAVLTAVMLLLFSVTFPVARALDPVTISAGIVAVSATIAIGSILVGLGVLPGTDVTAFNVLIEDIKTGLGDAWTYTTAAGDTMIKLLCLHNNYFAQHELVADVLSLVHSYDIATQMYLPTSTDFVLDDLIGPGVISYYSSIIHSSLKKSSEYPYLRTYSKSDTGYALLISSSDFTLTTYDGNLCYKMSGTLIYCLSGEPTLVSTSGYYFADSIVPLTKSLVYVSAVDDLDLGVLGISLDDAAYETWVADPLVTVDPGTSGGSGGDDDGSLGNGVAYVPLLVLRD